MSTILGVLFFLAAAPSAPGRTPAPAYTNVDLDRLAPRRGEGGIFETSVPVPPPAAAGKSESRAGTPDRGEEYWRREAEKARDRIRPLEARAEVLRTKIAERRRTTGIRPYSDPGVRALERVLTQVTDQAREIETRLEDRARRARALPGWLR